MNGCTGPSAKERVSGSVGRPCSVQAGGNVEVLKQRVVGDARICGQPRGVLPELCRYPVRQQPPDCEEPLARPRQPVHDLLDECDGPVRLRGEGPQLQLNTGAACRVRESEAVRRAHGTRPIPGGR